MTISKATATLLIGMLAVFLTGTSAQAGISRVAKRINVMSFYAGSSSITGSYGGLGSDSWQEWFLDPSADPSVDGDEIFESSFHFGMNYGQIRNAHILTSVGFQYTDVAFKDSVVFNQFSDFIYTIYPDAIWDRVNLFDFYFSGAYLFNDIQKDKWTPYVGLNLKAGFMFFSYRGFDNESELKLSAGLDFGADIKIWTAAGNRSFVTLSSINSIDIVSSDNRPRYFSIGGGLKYFFRP